MMKRKGEKEAWLYYWTWMDMDVATEWTWLRNGHGMGWDQEYEMRHAIDYTNGI